jgi:ornithine cyclodeaminase
MPKPTRSNTLTATPRNNRFGLPTVMAFGVLADVDTGIPELLSELTLTTALRTAAMSVVAARALARPNSTRMALIGNGAQSEFQALAFHHLLGIQEIRLFDTDRAPPKNSCATCSTPRCD